MEELHSAGCVLGLDVWHERLGLLQVFRLYQHMISASTECQIDCAVFQPRKKLGNAIDLGDLE
jgi:hypothetical protein